MSSSRNPLLPTGGGEKEVELGGPSASSQGGVVSMIRLGEREKVPSDRRLFGRKSRWVPGGHVSRHKRGLSSEGATLLPQKKNGGGM